MWECRCWAEGDLNDYFMQPYGGGIGKGNGSPILVTRFLQAIDSVRNGALTNGHISGQVCSGFLRHT